MSPSPQRSFFGGRYPWRLQITTTVFWCGEASTPTSPSNRVSAWDKNWMLNAPRHSPFYCALPYNDVLDDHTTRSEAPAIIPWFRQTFVRAGQSVCKDRWIAIRPGGKVCYAQWEDAGPFCTDHWRYVFGNERPRPNRNHDTGLDVSPDVRDYLSLNDLGTCDWKFVDHPPPGPWLNYDSNNLALFKKVKSQ